MSVVVINSYTQSDVVALIFVSTASSSTILALGNGVGNPLTWTDGVDTYIGDSVTFVNWTAGTHNVTVTCGNPSLITGVTMGSKSLTEIDLSELPNLTGELDLQGNDLTVIVDPPVSNTVNKIQINNNSNLTSISWDAYQQCNDLQAVGCSSLSDIGLTGVAVDLKAIDYRGNGACDLSSFTGCEASTEIEIKGACTAFTAPSLGSGTISKLEFTSGVFSSLDLSFATKFTSTANYFINACDSLTSITEPTVTEGIIFTSSQGNDLITTVDLSGFPEFRIVITWAGNNLLATLTFPTITIGTKINVNLSNNDLDYTDFTVLTDLLDFNDVVLNLDDNSFTTTETNQHLVDFAAMVAAGGSRTGRVINIAGGGGDANDAPDGGPSGGDGDQAVIDLVAASVVVNTN